MKWTTTSCKLIISHVTVQAPPKYTFNHFQIFSLKNLEKYYETNLIDQIIWAKGNGKCSLIKLYELKEMISVG